MTPDFALGLAIGTVGGLAIGQAAALGLFYALWRLAANVVGDFPPEDRDGQ